MCSARVGLYWRLSHLVPVVKWSQKWLPCGDTGLDVWRKQFLCQLRKLCFKLSPQLHTSMSTLRISHPVMVILKNRSGHNNSDSCRTNIRPWLTCHLPISLRLKGEMCDHGKIFKASHYWWRWWWKTLAAALRADDGGQCQAWPRDHVITELSAHAAIRAHAWLKAGCSLCRPAPCDSRGFVLRCCHPGVSCSNMSIQIYSSFTFICFFA